MNSKKTTSQKIDNEKILENAYQALNQAYAKLEEIKNEKYIQPIAVIGMSCELPGGIENPDDFWSLLKNKQSAIREIPASRWDYHTNPCAYIDYKWGGFLDNYDKFDPAFFNISAREAELMDPQQRHALINSWKALEDANYSLNELSNLRCGVYFGAMNYDYLEILQKENSLQDTFELFGNSPSAIATRVSYFLNLKGPSLLVDTACSSSATAIHLACNALKEKEVDIALAGGVSIWLSQRRYLLAAKAGMISKSGKCRTFDDAADGFVPAEGIGVVVLKPLKKALADGDIIHGVILASSSNQDGKTNGVAAPNAIAQTELQKNLYQKAKISPETITYIEAHGTGTKLGDPIEVKALNDSFHSFTQQKQFCAIGSVKSNIGHTAAASGVISLIKVLLSLKNQYIPASLNVINENTHISFKTSAFYVNKEGKEWIVSDGARRAAINSFGHTGTNVHLIVEEAPSRILQLNNAKPYYFISISANNLSSLKTYQIKLYNWLNNHQNESIEAIAYTLNTARCHFKYRCALIVASTSELYYSLERLLNNELPENYFYNNEKTNDKNEFVESIINFSSQNSKTNTKISKAYKSKLIDLAKLYIQGYKIDWKLLHNNESNQKINLPTYSFLMERYIISSTYQKLNKLQQQSLRVYDYICSNSISSPLFNIKNENVFKVQLTGKEFYLSDHIINGEKILPGVVYIEMVRTIFEHSYNKNQFQLKNIVWLKPIIVKDNNIEINIKFETQDESIVYSVTTIINNQEIVHNQGVIINEQIQKPHHWTNIEDTMGMLPNLLDANSLYDSFKCRGLILGPSFRIIKWIKSNNNEAISYFCNNRNIENEQKNRFIEPGKLDSILQSIMCLLLSKENSSDFLFVPFSLDQFILYSDIPDEGYVYIKASAYNENTYNLQVIDKQENIILELYNFSLRKSQSNNLNNKSPRFHYYYPEWIKNTLMLNDQNLSINEINQKCICIFNYSEESLKGLQNDFIGTIFIDVQYDQEYKKINNKKYNVRSNESEDYRRLLTDLKNQNIEVCDFIIGNLNRDTQKDIEDYLNNEVQAIIKLIQCLLSIKREKNITILLPYFIDDSHLIPEIMFNGFAKSLIKEHAQSFVKLIGLDKLSSEKTLYSQIINELVYGKDFHVHYLNNIRMIEKYECKIDDFGMPYGSEMLLELPFNQSGVYLITGGLGGLGYITARYLAKSFGAKLILTGRSKLTSDKQSQIKQLEEMGSEVIYLVGDVSNKETVKKWIFLSKKRFGCINGIIHSAGYLKDGLLLKKDWNIFKSVLEPKVLGIHALDEATKEEKLDNFIVFSSLIAGIGNLGQTDYATANAFMDHFVNWRRFQVKQGNRHGVSLSIGWPYWSEGGMSLAKTSENYFIEEMGMLPLSTENGLKALEKCLRNAIVHPYVMVIHGYTHRLNNLFYKTADYCTNETQCIEEISSKIPEEQSSASESLLLNDVKLKIATAVMDILHVPLDAIDSSEDLSSYGFDSITFTELATHLKMQYGYSVTPALFFEYMNIDCLSQYLIKNQLEIIKNKYSSADINKKNYASYDLYENSCLNNPPLDDNYLSEKRELNAISNHTTNSFHIKDRTHTQEINIYNEADIAVIGLSGKLPGSDNIEVFWKNLHEGKDLIQEIPTDRWNWQEIYGDLPNQTKSKWGGFIPDVDKFDAAFFNISPREAELMDPQQRIFLETVWHAIEDSGYTPQHFASIKTGMFVGVATSDYTELLFKNNENSAHFSTGTAHSILANRISFLLNLTGPSEAIHTACSSSLVALHNAIKAINTGDCDVAIAGGVNVLLTPTMFISFSQGGMLSADGKCKTFDKSADGYVRGEGVGAIVLKPVLKAIQDGDNIYGIIKGSAVNHGGHVSSLTVPNPNAQSELITTAVNRAKINIDTISYIETHGTGTSLGDPIEVNGLKKSFSSINNYDDAFCGLGSVKSNIGHLEAAAGIAGIIKVLLSMKNKTIPGNLHFNELNPYIEIENSPFYIVNKTIHWKNISRDGQIVPRRAGVSSFGFGGTNAHIILEEAPTLKSTSNSNKPYYLITLSAKTEEALNNKITDLNRWLANQLIEPNINDLCFTLNYGRVHYEKRFAAVVNSISDLKYNLEQISKGNKLFNSYINLKIEYSNNTAIFKEIYKHIIEQLKSNTQLSNKDHLEKLLALANLYTEGYHIDWQSFYEGQLNQKISLPKYPFLKERHWISKHNLLQKTDNQSHNDILPNKNTNGSYNIPNNSQSLLAYSENISNSLADDVLFLIKTIVVDLLKINYEIDEDRDLGEYGMDSMNLIALTNAINRHYNLDLTTAVLIEHQTLSKLSIYLVDNHYEIIRQNNPNIRKNANIVKSSADISIVNQTNLPKSHDVKITLEQQLVLHIEEIVRDLLKINGPLDIDKDLSDYGMDSMNLIALTNTINRYYSLELVSAILLEQKTIRLLALYMLDNYNHIILDKLALREYADINLKSNNLNQKLTGFGEDKLNNNPSRINDNLSLINYEQRKYNLSLAQERLWFLYKLNPSDTRYNIGTAIHLTGPLNINAFFKAYQAIINRHEVLRTTFIENDGKVYAQVSPAVELEYVIHELTGQDNIDIKTHASNQFNDELHKTFDLEKGPLFRCSLNRYAPNNYVYIIIFHHIIFDGWSVSIYLNELVNNYNSFIKKNSLSLITLDMQFSKFVEAQYQRIRGDNLNNMLLFWEKYLSNLPSLCLPTDKPRTQIQSHIDIYSFNLSESLSNSLVMLSQTQGSTLFNILFSAYCSLLYRYSGQLDFSVGVSLHGREHGDWTNTIGFFVNLVPIRVVLKEDIQFSELVSQVKNVMKDILRWQEVPLEKLITKLNLERTVSTESLFQVSFLYERFSEQTNHFENINDEIILEEGGRIPCDLTLEVFKNTQNLKVNFKYNSNLYNRHTVEKMSEYWVVMLRGIVENYHETINKLQLLTNEDFNHIVYELNKTKNVYKSDGTIHSQYEEQVLRTPDNIAIVYNNENITYKMLNEKANQLANYILSLRSFKSDSFIALCLDRGTLAIVSILATLKVGAAYIPIDPSYPEDRILYQLNDSNADILICNENNIDKINCIINKCKIKLKDVISIDSEQTQNKLKNQSIENPKTNVNGICLAYVIYTSGTTGRPKGVLQCHSNVIRLFSATKDYFHFDASDVWAMFHSYVFDFTVWEIWGALLHGGKLVIPTQNEVKNLNTFYKLCIKHKVSVLNQTPTSFYQLADIIINNKLSSNKHSLKYIIFGGEMLNLNLLKPWIDHFGCDKPALINMYGITETTVHVTYKKIEKEDLGNISYIGKFIPDLKCYVLDSMCKPIPYGVIGELYIGGAGLARGYLNQEKLTNERFINNPFQTEQERKNNINTKLYKTGDLVRLFDNGELVYIGRNDDQVKIRGYRIELSEIENTISQYPGILRCIVLAKKHLSSESLTSSHVNLIAYYMSSKGLDESDIKNYISNHLPEYMIPTSFIRIDSIPITINGKVDLKALPDITSLKIKSVIQPKTDLQYTIRNLWAKALELDHEQISIHDDFFSLGGNSILIIKLVNDINKLLNLNIDLSAIYKFRTIEKLSCYIQTDFKQSDRIPLNHFNTPNEQILSYAQQRLWFINQYEEGTNAYNIPMVLRMKSDVSITRLIESLKQIVCRHEVLRTQIKSDSLGNYYQVIIDLKNEPFNIFEKNINTHTELENEITKACNHIFNLEAEFPIRITLYQLEKEYYLSIVLHHIAFDGWSINILFNELNKFYSFDEEQLPSLSIQYKDFAIWQKNYLNDVKLKQQLDYWKNKLKCFQTLNLKTDKNRPKEFNYQGNDISIEIDKAVSNKLRQLAKELDVSLFTVLLSAYYIMLKCYTAQNDIVIGISVANRPHSQLENMIGFFVNNLALRMSIQDNSIIKKFIQDVGQMIAESQIYQDLPFEKLVECLNIPRDTSRHPIFQVMFGIDNYTNGFEKVSNNLFEPYLPINNFYKKAKFDLDTTINDSAECLQITINYATSLFNESTIRSFIETYSYLLIQFSRLVDNSIMRDSMTLDKLDLISSELYKQMIINWNSNERSFNKVDSLIEIFYEQVTNNPDVIAINCNNLMFTFKQVDEYTNKLALYMNEVEHIQPGSLVAVCFDKSDILLFAIISILKLDCAYVPIDMKLPKDRILYILKDTNIKSILTTKNNQLTYLVNTFDKDIIRIICIDDYHIQNKINNMTSITINQKYNKTHLAYVIYTSGTTGNPKGVMIEQASIINYIYNIHTYALIKPGIKVDFSTNIGFDLTLTTTICALCLGAEIVIYTGELRDTDAYLAHLIDKKVEFIKQVPSYFELLINDLPLTNIKKIILGGEKVKKDAIDKISILYKGNQDFQLEIYDEYGPTETTVGAFINQIYPSRNHSLGRQYANYKAYVLNSDLKPLPPYAIGELYIGGIGLARGYLNNVSLTADKFIVNPFQSEEEKLNNSNTRLYKTGDLVRWLDTGEIEYIGRNDSQVKIRGNRVELAEIETVIKLFNHIEQAVVIQGENDTHHKVLIAYIVSKDPNFSIEKLKEFLSNTLPDYMIPNLFQILDKIPLTINGKLDKETLSKLIISTAEEVILPRNDLELALRKIWSSILNIPETIIGVDHNFFNLGGDSISSIHLVNKIRAQFKTKVTVKDIFTYKTIREFSKQILTHQNDNVLDFSHNEQGILEGEFSLLPIQRWFFQCNFPKPNHWNQAFTIRTPKLEVNKLKESVHKLIQHHDAFNLRFYQKAGSPEIVQAYHPSLNEVNFKTFNINTLVSKKELDSVELELSKLFTKWQSYFNLEHGPLYVIVYIHGFKDESARIFFAMHHLMVDIVSWRIIVEDLQNLYEGNSLGYKSSSYRQWVNAINDYTKSNQNQILYWSNVISDFDMNQNQVFKENASKCIKKYFTLEKNITNLLLREANNIYLTKTKDLLVSSLFYALSSITKKSVNHILLEGHGREEIDNKINLSKTVGWFTALYPVRIEVLENFYSTINTTKEILKSIPHNGVGYGAICRYQNNIPNIVFNYLGQFDNSEELWKIIDGYCGTLINKSNNYVNNININCMIINGQFRCEIEGYANILPIKKLLIEFENKLKEIINHCISHETFDYPRMFCEDFIPYILANEKYSNIVGNLFVLPPGHGGAESYLSNIVPKIQNRKLILFNNYYNYLQHKYGNKYLNNLTYEKLASEYIIFVKAIQPNGPYELFGWSSGGVLAFEIARQLSQKGDHVSKLILIDAFFNHATAANSISSEIMIDAINHKYTPSTFLNIKTENLILFKATQYANNHANTIFEYFAKHTQANHLDAILEKNTYTLITMEHTHDSWLLDECQLDVICSKIN